MYNIDYLTKMNCYTIINLQGVSFVRDAGQWWTRMVWVFLILVALAMASWMLHGVFTHYFSYPINTRINLGRRTLDFPSITLCNINPIRLSQVAMSPTLKTFNEQIGELWDNKILPKYLKRKENTKNRKKVISPSKNVL